MNKTLKIGVVGYSAQSFDERSARQLIHNALSGIALDHHVKFSDLEIVSGLTNLGIPALAYGWAAAAGTWTTGIACSKAHDYECFPVDHTIIVGDDWSDESETFLNYIDVLVRVGGGKQSHAEVAAFRLLKPDAMILEYNL